MRSRGNCLNGAEAGHIGVDGAPAVVGESIPSREQAQEQAVDDELADEIALDGRLSAIVLRKSVYATGGVSGVFAPSSTLIFGLRCNSDGNVAEPGVLRLRGCSGGGRRPFGGSDDDDASAMM